MPSHQKGILEATDFQLTSTPILARQVFVVKIPLGVVPLPRGSPASFRT